MGPSGNGGLAIHPAYDLSPRSTEDGTFAGGDNTGADLKPPYESADMPIEKSLTGVAESDES